MKSEIGNNASYRKIRTDTWGAPHRKARTEFSRKLRAILKSATSKIFRNIGLND